MFTPPPRYFLRPTSVGHAILLHTQPIAHTNPYRRQSQVECAQLVADANVASTTRIALKECAAALLTMEACGFKLPQPVIEAKNRAFAALAATQR